MRASRISTISRRVPSHVTSIIKQFHELGFECYLVGGAVRSLITGTRPSDFDLTTDATPDEIMQQFRRVVPTGIAHGTVTIVSGKNHYEVTTYRSEGTYSDSRRPDSVSFVRDLATDLSRRDFTMNAIALDPARREVVDLFGGEDDIARRIVRSIGNPLERFTEDALRMLRAARFASQLGFTVTSETMDAMHRLHTTIGKVSPERIRDEFEKIVMSSQPSVGLRLLHQTGLLKMFLPELNRGVGVEQRGNHQYDVFEHSVRACDAAPSDSVELRLSALLHDIGKPPTLSVDEDGFRTFHGHDRVSAELTEALLRRLKFPNRVVERVTHLVRHHMFDYSPDWKDAAVRRLISRVGDDAIEQLVSLRRADSVAVAGQDPGRYLDELLARVDRERDRAAALTIRDLAVNGNDLIQLGIPKGKTIGLMLELLLETVLDDPSQNTKDQLSHIAGRLYQERIAGQLELP